MQYTYAIGSWRPMNHQYTSVQLFVYANTNVCLVCDIICSTISLNYHTNTLARPRQTMLVDKELKLDAKLYRWHTFSNS